MSVKRRSCPLILLVWGLSCFVIPGEVHADFHLLEIDHNPFLADRMQQLVASYLLPSGHPAKTTLDFIFSQREVLDSERTLSSAGFTLIAGPMPLSYVIVARHSAVPGYVFKLYLNTESRSRKQVPHWIWLLRRCIGARGIKKIIEREGIVHFSVPDKWLYLLPSTALHPQAVILMETDMDPESCEVSKRQWRTGVTRKMLDELYAILKHGYGGSGTLSLCNNVPYTRNGTFAFTDTEDPRAKLKLKYIKRFLSMEMAAYWDSLINKR
jgi:hypothetical protein